MNKEISHSSIILPLVQDRLPHPVDILLALILTLLQVDIRYHLLPPCLLAKFPVLLPELLLFLDVLSSPLLFLFLLPADKLVELSLTLGLPGILLLVFLILDDGSSTLLIRNSAWMRSYYYRIRRVI